MDTIRGLSRSTPEAQGISSSAVLDFVTAIEQAGLELHSLMLVRHGCVVAEGWWHPYAPQHPHMLFSLSKSFTSTAVGMAVQEGLLSVEDTVVSFFPKEAPAEISENLAAMRVRHLLTMSTGHAEDTTGRITQASNWVKAFLSLPVENPPGAPFVYNSGATYMLSAIVQKVTGQTLLDFLTPRLFEPLGFENPTWESCPRGINTGGWGLCIRTEEIARFGQLYLQKGVWNGQRLLSESWVEEATRKQVSNGDDENSDWAQGYGYQFWRCRHNIYRGDGAFGQYCIVMPDQDAVLAITSGLRDMQAVLNQVWDHLLPAMTPAALPENPAEHARLTARLNSLEFLPPVGQVSSPIAERVSGKVYRFEPNEQNINSISVVFSPESCILRVHADGKLSELNCGWGKWAYGETTLFDKRTLRSAASAVWTAEDALSITVRMYETPFSDTTCLRFTDDQVTLDHEMNVGFGENKFPTLTGRAE